MDAGEPGEESEISQTAFKKPRSSEGVTSLGTTGRCTTTHSELIFGASITGPWGDGENHPWGPNLGCEGRRGSRRTTEYVRQQKLVERGELSSKGEETPIEEGEFGKTSY